MSMGFIKYLVAKHKLSKDKWIRRSPRRLVLVKRKRSVVPRLAISGWKTTTGVGAWQVVSELVFGLMMKCWSHCTIVTCGIRARSRANEQSLLVTGWSLWTSEAIEFRRTLKGFMFCAFFLVTGWDTHERQSLDWREYSYNCRINQRP